MEELALSTESSCGQIKVVLLRKNIKNENLRVYRDMIVKLSVPYCVQTEWIENFLNSRKDWIVKKLEIYRSTEGYNNLFALTSGSSTQMLGKDMRIIKVKGDKNQVSVDENKIFVYIKDCGDESALIKLFSDWWRKRAMEVYSEQVEILYKTVFRKF